jgi:ribonuclease HII
MSPSTSIEQQIFRQWNVNNIAGLDEAGRGAIAGPVVAAAVVLPLNQPDKLTALYRVDDSKQLPAKLRDSLFDLILENAVSFGIASSSSAFIDRHGIIAANARAMSMAVANLKPLPGYLIIDGRMRLRNVNIPQESIIRGDSKSLSIAAASILAKVSRDRYMIDLDVSDGRYHFSSHKGYCTRNHVEILAKYGPCSEHRRSFAPLRQSLV